MSYSSALEFNKLKSSLSPYSNRFAVYKQNMSQSTENGLPRQPGQRRRHWSSFMYLCDFCSVEYDFIGKMDTLNTDVNYVLNAMNVSKLTEYPTGYSTKRYLKKALF